MQKTASRVRTGREMLILAPKEAYRLFHLSSEMAEALEDVLESRAGYSREFMRGLVRAHKQAARRDLKKIKSLAELA